MQYDIDMTSKHKSLFLQIRSFLLSLYDINEKKKDRITTYSNSKGGICHMRTMPYGVDIGFLKGAKMEDGLNALSGNGKAMRVLKIMDFDQNVIEYYLRQAIEINNQ
jgi:hypothetical protein